MKSVGLKALYYLSIWVKKPSRLNPQLNFLRVSHHATGYAVESYKIIYKKYAL